MTDQLDPEPRVSLQCEDAWVFERPHAAHDWTGSISGHRWHCNGYPVPTTGEDAS